MRGPVTELRAFLGAALVEPAVAPPVQDAAALRRRRTVAAATLLVGAPLLAYTLRIPAGDPSFYLATLALAAVWSIGALASGPLHAGWGHTRREDREARPVVQSLALGGLLLAVFLGAALVVGRIPALRDPVDGLLAHARSGSTLGILAVTAVNGVVEELYFRGALFAALPRYPVAVTTALYALTTVGAGVPLLTVAAVLLGLLTALQRRVTGGIAGPIITHLVWSTGMLLLLPAVLGTGQVSTRG